MNTNDKDGLTYMTLSKAVEYLSQWGRVDIQLPNLYSYIIIISNEFGQYEMTVFPNGKTFLNEKEFMESLSSSMIDLYNFKETLEEMFNTIMYGVA